MRHLVIGSPQGVRGAINHLHLLRYTEQRESWRVWSTSWDEMNLVCWGDGDLPAFLELADGNQSDKAHCC